MRNISLIIITIISILMEKSQSNVREKRFLTFPPTTPTRYQFIWGIGIPVDLELESLTIGYVLKIEYFLPINASSLHPENISPQPIDATKKRSILDKETEVNLREAKTAYKPDKRLSRYRWAVYKGFEALFDRMGYPGRICMLRSICEAAETSFHNHSGLFGELMHIIMTPSASVDKIDYHPINMYFYAEKMGKSGAPCGQVFKDCKDSVLEKFSKILE